MSKVDVSLAVLHDDLFLGGKNHSKKLDPFRYPDLKIQYDRAEKELLVTWKNATALIPSSNISSLTLGKPEDRKIVQMGHPMVAGAAQTAQVETPMSHVHAGPGRGKTK